MLVSTPPDIASPEEAVIAGDGWFPEIDLNAMRAALRVGTVVTHERLVQAVRFAWSHVADELWAWRAEQEEKGFAELSAVSDRQVDGENRLAFLFTSAVQYMAEAWLFERYQDISATGEDGDRADSKRDQADDSKRDATHAIRDIKGKKRTRTRLI